MSSSSDKVMCIAALGRPFHLGMLYDCRNEKLIQGITLWDKSKLERKLTQHHETSHFSIITSDSLEAKASALEVNANQKLSFLGGLLSVSGSANYLDNRKTSNHHERVALQYKCTTKSEEMTMEQLGQGNVQYPEVLDHETATHVVTGILYGAQAIFVFERNFASSSNNMEAPEDLHDMVKLIPKLEINSKGDVNISESEKKKVENFTCTFIGDFLLPEHTFSYQDAVKIYKEIPKLLGQGQNAVPVTVTLYPLTLLYSRASVLFREINADLINDTEDVFEHLHELTVRCNDLCNSFAVKQNVDIQNEICKFKSLIAIYKCKLQRQLSVLLPSIKSGSAEESCLADLLKKKEASSFNYHELQAWVQDEEKLVHILSKYIKIFSEIKFASGDLDSIKMSLDNDYTLCFNILRPNKYDFLAKMEMYNRNEYDPDNDHSTDERNSENTLLTNYEADEISMMKKAILFRNFYASNKERIGTAFIVAVNFSETSDYQAHIQLYRHDCLLNGSYELPSAPGMPLVDSEKSSHDNITIYWTKPKYGASSVHKYEILCQKVRAAEPTGNFMTGSDTLSFTIPNVTVKDTGDLLTKPDIHSFIIPDLEPNCVYQVCVRSWCEAGVGPTSDINPAVTTRPASPPGKPQVWQISSTTVEIQWSKPLYIGSECSIQNYILKKQEKKESEWITIAITKADELVYRAEVTPNTVPKFKVAAYFGDAGYSVESNSSDNILEKTDNGAIKSESSKMVKEKFCAALKPDHIGTPCIYMLQPKLVMSEEEDLIRQYELGTPLHNVQEKVILIVGATGSGKTTLINGLINYIIGVNWRDDFRFKLISEDTDGNQAKSQTKHITSYTIHHQEGFNFPHTLTIVDTPGFGDTSGVMRDRHITNQIHRFFTTKGTEGIDHIDAVGFVVQASLPRLTPTQKYIFDQILSLFGKDIKDNIFLLLTFADGQQPQVLSSIIESGLPYQKLFKFNNSALYANKTEIEGNITTEVDSDDEENNGNFDEMFWQMGERSFKMFLQRMNVVESKSLLLTQDVLNKRGQLQSYITGIHLEIQVGLSTLETLKKEAEIVRIHQVDIDKNKNFTYTVQEEVFVAVPVPRGHYVTNCQQCNRTCHALCSRSQDEMKYKCMVMSEGKCTVCPQNCHWSVHKNFPMKYVPQTVTVTKTATDLREHYEKAKQEKLSAENLIAKIQDEFKAVQLKVLGMTESVRKSLERLQEIALKPNPLSAVEYIDILIESEKSQRQPGWRERVEQLCEVRKEAEYMKKIADQGFDPFEDYIKKIEIEKKANPRSAWATVGQYLSKIFK
nr:LOW QUALITY PROTEIN: uncharacterized protein LOC128699919 [Cherax quadricarinatus]